MVTRIAHRLDRLLNPRSIAVVGASERPLSVGQVVLRNLLRSEFEGDLYAVNPRHDFVQGVPCLPSMTALPSPVDLMVIATPARTIPGILEEGGAAGARAAVILSAGFSESGPEGEALEKAALAAAARHNIRIIGPNCVGVIRPAIGMNATFSYQGASPGRLALVSQSGAVCTAILDWAPAHSIGFSAVISLGIGADVGFGELLDYFALDPDTDAILLYVEGVRHARSFMSGLRAAARLKPVIVVKAGRHTAGAKAAASHTGSLVGSDDAFDAALRRAGAVRVVRLEELFSAAEFLTARRKLSGNRVGIVTNAGGPGVLAADRVVDVGLTMAALGPETLDALNQALPAHWSHGNPVDVLGDAPPPLYRRALETVLADRNVDAALMMFTPQAISDPLAVAGEVIAAMPGVRKPVLACWLGEEQVAEARHALDQAGIPCFSTPEAAIEALGFLATYNRNQQLLLQVPGPGGAEESPDTERARKIVNAALDGGRTLLDSVESRTILEAFGIPTLPAKVARSAGEAAAAAKDAGFPVAMKIYSRQITHKTDVGGVRLDLADEESVAAAFDEMVATVARRSPGAVIEGVTIEPMLTSREGRELLVGAVRDVAFGPIIAFGSGGILVELLDDRAVALPPLNRVIARDLIGRTRAAKLLGPIRGMEAADNTAVEDVLLSLSAMLCELPEIVELDINPLVADSAGAIAIDARIVVSRVEPGAEEWSHLAIHPYPGHLETRMRLATGQDVVVRPIRPEDAEAEQAFVQALSLESRVFRFHNPIQGLTPDMLARFTQVDYDREMALVAVLPTREQIAVARYATEPDGGSCEFAIVVADAYQGQGIATYMLRRLMEIGAARGLQEIHGHVRRDNANMLDLVRRLGFEVLRNADDPTVALVSRELAGFGN